MCRLRDVKKADECRAEGPSAGLRTSPATAGRLRRYIKISGDGGGILVLGTDGGEKQVPRRPESGLARDDKLIQGLPR
jgi:hypothetical protein